MTELLTALETAQLLRCSLRTLDRERSDGRGCPFVRIGGRIRYRRADVEAFIAAHVRGHVTGVVPNVPPVSEEVLQQRAAAAERIRALIGGKTRDDIGPASNDEITRKDAPIEELPADERRLEIENIGLRSEVEETKAVRKPEGEGEGSELGNLLRAWDRASQGAREKFKARVGLVGVEPRAGDGLDIAECLRRAAP